MRGDAEARALALMGHYGVGAFRAAFAQRRAPESQGIANMPAQVPEPWLRALQSSGL